MLKTIRNSFITGIIVVLPLTITVFVVVFLIGKIGTPVSEIVFAPIFNFFGRDFPQNAVGSTLLDLVSTLIVLALITAIGFFSRFFFGKLLINLSEFLIEKIPFARTVYKTVKQIVDTFSKQKKAVFQEVVLTEFPRKGMYAIGFLTSDSKGEVQAKTGERVLNVFIPTTPNPTSGFLVMIPEDSVTHLDMTISEGMKLIISGGAVVPPWGDFEGSGELAAKDSVSAKKPD